MNTPRPWATTGEMRRRHGTSAVMGSDSKAVSHLLFWNGRGRYWGRVPEAARLRCPTLSPARPFDWAGERPKIVAREINFPMAAAVARVETERHTHKRATEFVCRVRRSRQPQYSFCWQCNALMAREFGEIGFVWQPLLRGSASLLPEAGIGEWKRRA